MKLENSSTDSKLVDQYSKGDEKAFEDLINRYRTQVYSYLYRMVRDSETAKDLFQDVVISVLKALPKYKDNQKFSNWLFRIAHNTAMNFIQRHKRKSKFMVNITSYNPASEFSQILPDESQSPENLLADQEMLNILNSSIAKLPVEQREIILLRQYSNMTFKEIAHILDCPLNTVLGRMRYALLNLRKMIQTEIRGDISDVL